MFILRDQLLLLSALAFLVALIGHEMNLIDTGSHALFAISLFESAASRRDNSIRCLPAARY